MRKDDRLLSLLLLAGIAYLVVSRREPPGTASLSPERLRSRHGLGPGDEITDQLLETMVRNSSASADDVIRTLRLKPEELSDFLADSELVAGLSAEERQALDAITAALDGAQDHVLTEVEADDSMAIPPESLPAFNGFGATQ